MFLSFVRSSRINFCSLGNYNLVIYKQFDQVNITNKFLHYLLYTLVIFWTITTTPIAKKFTRYEKEI